MADLHLQCGDSLVLLRGLAPQSVDAVITDPPYSSGGLHQSARNQTPLAKYLTRPKKQYPDFYGDNRDQRSHALWYCLWLAECFRVMKEEALICVFSDWRQLPLTADALQAAGFLWRGIVVWDKTQGARPQKNRFAHQAEYVVWGSKGYMPTQGRCLPGLYSHFPKSSEKFHIAGKPVALFSAFSRFM